MYLIEAVKTIEMNLRSTCMMLEVVRNQQLDRAIENDWLPMQDHLAQCVPGNTMWLNSSVKDCVEYLERVYDGLKRAEEHVSLAYKMNLMLHPEVAYIADMLWSDICNKYPNNYVACAKECYKVYEQLKPKYGGVKSDKFRLEWQREMMMEFDKICKKHKVKFTIHGEWSLSEGYLMDWLGRKYYEI